MAFSALKCISCICENLLFPDANALESRRKFNIQHISMQSQRQTQKRATFDGEFVGNAICTAFGEKVQPTNAALRDFSMI